MDVKELNNGSTIQAMFVKAAASVVWGQVASGDFASLVGDASEMIASKIEVKKEQSFEVGDIVKPQKNNVRDKEIKDKQKIADKSAASTEETSPRGQSDKKKIKSDDKIVANDYVAEAPKVTDKAIKEGAEVVVTENGEVVLSQDFNMNEVVPEQVIQVFDEASGEMVQMSGTELISKIRQADANDQLFIVSDVAESGKILEDLSLDEVIKQDRNFKQMQSDILQTGEQELEDTLLAEQAKVLDEKLGGDKKLKVDVDVIEENFSYTDKKELIKEQPILEDVSAKVLEGNGVFKQKTNGENTVSTLVNNNQQNQIAQQIDMNNVFAANNVNFAMTDAAKVVTGDANVSAVSTETSVLNVAGTILEAKADIGQRTFDNTSRDVFKGMTKEVVEQVKVNITKSAVKGVDKIDIHLKPEDLGNIEIKMQISKDGKLQAHIVATRQETMEILQREVQDLEKAFNAAGFETDSGSFSFSFRGENEADQNAKLRSFIGDALEKDATELAVDNDNLAEWSSAQGLNIKV